MSIKKETLLASTLTFGITIGLLSMAATPAVASSDPSWFINCGVQHLGIYQLSNSAPLTQAMCQGTSGNVNIFSVQLSYAGGPFTGGSLTGARIFFAATAAGGISGTWTLNDVSTSKTISSGSFAASATDTTGSCTPLNQVTSQGTANSGQIVTQGDTMRMTISYSATGGGVFSLCSGGSSPSSTNTQIGVSAAVPEFGAAAALPAALAFLLLRLKTRSSTR